MRIFHESFGLFRKVETVTFETEAPEKDTPIARLMKFQKELSKLIEKKDGKISITIAIK